MVRAAALVRALTARGLAALKRRRPRSRPQREGRAGGGEAGESGGGGGVARGVPGARKRKKEKGERTRRPREGRGEGAAGGGGGGLSLSPRARPQRFFSSVAHGTAARRDGDARIPPATRRTTGARSPRERGSHRSFGLLYS